MAFFIREMANMAAVADVEEEGDAIVLIPFTKRRLDVFRKWLGRAAEMMGEFDVDEWVGVPECLGVVGAYMSYDWEI